MPSLVAVVVGVGARFNVEALAKTFVEKSKQQLDPRKVAFYAAKRGGEWLSAQEVDALKRGKVPVGVKAVMSSRNQMGPKAPVSHLAFGLQDIYSAAQVHVLVDVPENVKRNLRRSFAGQISFNKLMYYNGTDLEKFRILTSMAHCNSCVVCGFRRAAVATALVKLAVWSCRLHAGRVSLLVQRKSCPWSRRCLQSGQWKAAVSRHPRSWNVDSGSGGLRVGGSQSPLPREVA